MNDVAAVVAMRFEDALPLNVRMLCASGIFAVRSDGSREPLTLGSEIRNYKQNIAAKPELTRSRSAIQF